MGDMTNRAYDVAKWVALVALPASATFYAALATIWGWAYITEVVGTITAVNALLGTLLGISSIQYKADKNPVLVHKQQELPFD